MSETTNIEWATSTGNPWIGCTKVSPGCKNCYAAELDANRFSKTMGGGTKEKPVIHWGKGAPRFKTKQLWKDARKWDREHAALNKNIQLTDRPRIFPSLCDWLDEEVPIEWLADFLTLIHETPNLDWLLLTKRPQNFQDRIYAPNVSLPSKPTQWMIDAWRNGTPPANVWLGVSVEDQKRADERIPILLTIPAKVRFLSVEPLLEPIDFHKIPSHLGSVNAVNGNAFYAGESGGHEYSFANRGMINWAIIGAESGGNRRDCGLDAIVSAAAFFKSASVKVFIKQDCAFKPGQQGRIPAETWALKQFPSNF